MSTLGFIILFTFIGSIVSLVGGLALLLKEKFALKISHLLASFAAGTLLATAFFDLLPEAMHEAEESGKEPNEVLLWTLAGILLFFLLERFLYWFHHHHEESDAHSQSTVSLVVLGDTVHNFLDGVVIAATFLVSVPLGIVTSLAVAAHEIPQEIGDFGILLHKRVKKRKIIFINVASALASLLGALITYSIGESVRELLPVFIAITAGFFIYIASSDLIPEIHQEKRPGYALYESILLLLGVVTVFLAILLLEPFTH